MDDPDIIRHVTRRKIEEKTVKYIKTTRILNKQKVEDDFIYALLYSYDESNMQKDMLKMFNHLYTSYFSLYTNDLPFQPDPPTYNINVDNKEKGKEENKNSSGGGEGEVFHEDFNEFENSIYKGKNNKAFVHMQERIKFIQETFTFIKNSKFNMIKKFIVLIIIGREQKIRYEVSQLCPKTTVDRVFPYLIRESIKITHTAFTKFNIEKIIENFMEGLLKKYMSDV